MRAKALTRNTATSRAASCPAYGGSANATSYWPGWSRSAKRSASARWIAARSSTSSVLTLALSVARAKRCSSTKSALAAPRDSASKPSAPEPANRSSTRAPLIERCRMENHASRTRSAVGRTLSVAGVLSRRPLNSPAIIRTMPAPAPPRMRNSECGMRNVKVSVVQRANFQGNSTFHIPHSALSNTGRHRRDPRLQRRPPLPLVALQPERHVQPLGEPLVRNRVGPLERDGRQRARLVVQREAQVVRAHAPRAHGAGAAHPEHRRGIAGAARLQIADQLLQLLAHEPQGELQVHALRRYQVVGAQKLACDREKRNTKVLVALPPKGEPRRHGVAAVFLEMGRHSMQRGVEVEARDAPPRAAPGAPSLVPADEKGGPAVTLHQPRRHDADHAGMPRVRREHQRPVLRPPHALCLLDRLVEDALVQRLAPRVERLQLPRDGGGLGRIV